RMSKEAGDLAFADQCRQWLDTGRAILENKASVGKYYLRYLDPQSGERSNDIFSAQLDGQMTAWMHGVEDVSRPDRVRLTLDTIKRTCVAATRFGTVLYTTVDGTATQGGTDIMPSYQPTEGRMQAVGSLGLTYMYAGQTEFGLELMRRVFHSTASPQSEW